MLYDFAASHPHWPPPTFKTAPLQFSTTYELLPRFSPSIRRFDPVKRRFSLCFTDRGSRSTAHGSLAASSYPQRSTCQCSSLCFATSLPPYLFTSLFRLSPFLA